MSQINVSDTFHLGSIKQPLHSASIWASDATLAIKPAPPDVPPAPPHQCKFIH